MTTAYATEEAGIDPAPAPDPQSTPDADPLLGASPAMQGVRRQLEQDARSRLTVLLLGETGTGKGLTANRLHELSPQADGPFVQVNCAALPENLIESELFGHERGAFTGAVAQKLGRVEVAGGGTLFLDEIGELPLAAQAKLLRLLDNGQYERVGGTEVLRAQARVVAATNQDLGQMVKERRFRADLFFRLRVLTVQLPPLWARREDILELAEHFIGVEAAYLGRPAPGLSLEAEAMLMAYAWPGNVRELKDIMAAALTACPGPTIRGEDLPHIDLEAPAAPCGPFVTIQENERRYLQEVLEATRWTIKGAHGAAAIVNLPPSTLYHRIDKLGLARPAGRDGEPATVYHPCSGAA